MSFALIGPEQTDVARLKALPNVHLFGQRPHADLPRYVRGFDVGLVPYRITEYTANVYPTKLNEYLVMGIPVVATDLVEIRRFNSEHGEIVRIAGSADAFASEVSAAIGKVAPPAEVERRIAVAESNSWERRLEKMSTLIESEIDARSDRAPRAGKTGSAGSTTPRRRARRRSPARCWSRISSIFQTNLVWWLAEPLRISEPARASDAIVVFAGGVGESGQAGGGVQERISKAISLYREGVAPRMIISSGFVFTLHEAEVDEGHCHRQRRAGRRDPPRGACVEHLSRTCPTRATSSPPNGWRRIALDQLAVPYAPRADDVAQGGARC